MDPVLADCSLRQIVCRVWLSFIHKIPYFTSGNSFVRQILYLFYHTLDWRQIFSHSIAANGLAGSFSWVDSVRGSF